MLKHCDALKLRSQQMVNWSTAIPCTAHTVVHIRRMMSVNTCHAVFLMQRHAHICAHMHAYLADVKTRLQLGKRYLSRLETSQGDRDIEIKFVCCFTYIYAVLQLTELKHVQLDYCRFVERLCHGDPRNACCKFTLRIRV